MEYLFENENALELWFYLTKELGVKITPLIVDEEFCYISEEYLTHTLVVLNREFDYDKETHRFSKKS